MSRRYWIAIAVSLGLGCHDGTPALTFPGCEALTRPAEPQAVPVVLIVNDTMRADRMGAYGGPARTPVFDRFAGESLLFLRAYAQAPWTQPSIATLFTSLYPSQHGWSSDGEETHALPASLTTLAETFRAAGYRTAAFVSNPWLEHRLGLGQGFDVYDDSFAAWTADGARVSEAALAWLADAPEGEPFFLYLHYMDSHRPYPALSFDEVEARYDEVRDEREFSAETRRRIAAVARIEGGDAIAAGLVPRTPGLAKLAYDKGIERFDAALGTFLAGLDASWAGERAAVLITSDHGEALFDRGYGNHGQGLHDDEIAVPLAARLPGVSPARGRIECGVGLVDVMPTLCDYLALDCPEPMFGRSWLDGRDDSDGRLLVSEGVGGQPRHRAVIGPRYKLLWQPGVPPDGPDTPAHTLYDLRKDPGEWRNLSASGDAETRRVLESLVAALPGAVPPLDVETGERVELDEELREQLRRLGYLE